MSRPPGALVTRPREDAKAISGALERRGFAVRIEPLLTIVTKAGSIPAIDGVQGILATSANGVRAFAAQSAERDLPLWAVGDATARCAGEFGFHRVASAGGDVESLAALVASRAEPNAGALLHVAGTAVAGDLAGRLQRHGFDVRRAVLYEAQPATALSAALCAALDGDELDIALFFSPRTAETFATLTETAGRTESCRKIVACALSPAVAGRLSRLPWQSVIVAARPDQDALLAGIDNEIAARGGTP